MNEEILEAPAGGPGTGTEADPFTVITISEQRTEYNTCR